MSQESELLLRKSLDSVDRNRRRLNMIFLVLFCVLLGLLLWLSRTTDIRELLLLSSVIVVFSVVYGVIVLAIYINRMARLILRAIDLTRRDATDQSPSSSK
jgi:hypothetical protein